MTTDAIQSASRFTKTSFVTRKERTEKLAKWVFFAMAVAMIIPLVAIVTYLLVRAAPSLNWEFIFDVPRRGMREGGIWTA